MTNSTNSPLPDDSDGDPPRDEQVSLTPGESVSLEIPANTNLVINVVPEKPKGLVGSLMSGIGCLFSGIFWLVVIFWIIAWITP